MKNKKAQAGLPINYTIVLVIAVLVIGIVFYSAVKFELIGKVKDLPIGDEEQEVVDEIEVAEVCVEKVGYFAKSDQEGYDTGYRYLHYMNGTILQIYKDEKKLWGHARPGNWRSYIFTDKQVGSLLDFGNDYIVFNCNAGKFMVEEVDTSSKLTQKDFDYFQGSFTIAGFVQEGKEIICRNNKTASEVKCLTTS